jgi:HEPN domain-containing protein
MSGPDPAAERDAEVRRWVRSAREDLRGARAAARDSDLLPRHACHLAQQAAEKALKAVLVYGGVPVPRIHDLDRLRALVPDPAAWSIARLPLDLAPLTVFATQARYPGEGPDPDAADAAGAIATAGEAVTRVVADLRRRGLTFPPPRRRPRRGPRPRRPSR